MSARGAYEYIVVSLMLSIALSAGPEYQIARFKNTSEQTCVTALISAPLFYLIGCRSGLSKGTTRRDKLI